ncbi:MAG: hypothetical protein J6Y20_14050 [Lachnospiraceae bacterium]|nr:hypothetical protein [Lachnospiraceae bacterium]
MGKNNGGEQQQKKSGGKKSLVAVLLVALLGLGAYGGAKLYDNQNEPEKPKEKVTITISVSAETVKVDNQEQKLADGQTWKKWVEDYFAKKDMSNTEVVVDFGYGDNDIVTEIKSALADMKITTTEKQEAAN